MKKNTMELYRRLGVVASLCVSIALATGCGRQISHEKEVEVDGSEVTVKEKTVTEHQDGGSVTVTEKKTVDDPSTGTHDSETETKTTTVP